MSVLLSRYRRPMRSALPLLLLLAACPPLTLDDDTTGDDDVTGDDDTTPDVPSSCEGQGVSTLEGTCFVFPEEGGSWTLAEAAAGISVPYTLLIEAPLPSVVTLPQDAGGCGEPGPSGLITFEALDGGDQRYCLCDTGLCMGPDETPFTLLAGTTALDFVWEGRNWIGPSDTGNEPGAPFPVGTYALTVSAVGRVDGLDFEVSNTFTVTLTN